MGLRNLSGIYVRPLRGPERRQRAASVRKRACAGTGGCARSAALAHRPSRELSPRTGVRTKLCACGGRKRSIVARCEVFLALWPRCQVDPTHPHSRAPPFSPHPRHRPHHRSPHNRFHHRLELRRLFLPPRFLQHPHHRARTQQELGQRVDRPRHGAGVVAIVFVAPAGVGEARGGGVPDPRTPIAGCSCPVDLRLRERPRLSIRVLVLGVGQK